MKKVLIAILVFWVIMTFGSCVSNRVFQPILGGSVEQTYLYPIYGGIVALAGLVVLCTVVILEKMDEIKKMLEEKREQEEKDGSAE